MRHVTVELVCLACGHGCAEIRITRGHELARRELRAAYASVDGARPEWDAHGEPRCPRCRARLFIDWSARQPTYAAVAPPRRSRPRD